MTTLDQYNLLFLISALLLILCKLIQPKRFGDFLRLTGYGTYNQIHKRPTLYVIQKFDLLLFFQFILAVSTFLSLYKSELRTVSEIRLSDIYFNGSVLLIYFPLKRILELGAGSWLKIESQIGAYVFQKMNSLHFFGLWLLLINMLIVYSFGPTIWMFYIALILGLIILFLGFITTFFRFRFLIRRRWLLFILYICTFEIAPLVVLWKIFKNVW